MIEWPPEPQLPSHVLMEGFQPSFADGRIRTEMDRGFAKQRGSSLGAPLTVPCMAMLTLSQVARLRRFWDEDTAGGNLWFILPDQVFDGTPLRTETGEILYDESGVMLTIGAYWLARFAAGAPVFPPVTPSEDYKAVFALDVRPI